MNFTQRADGATVNPPLEGLDIRALTGRQKMCGSLGLARRLDDEACFLQTVRNGLMQYDVLALFHCRDRHGRMEMIGRHDFDRVYVLFLVEQLAKVDIRSNPLERLRLSLVRVIDFRGLFEDVAST